jgi:hypothetical protein
MEPNQEEVGNAISPDSQQAIRLSSQDDDRRSRVIVCEDIFEVMIESSKYSTWRQKYDV